MSNNYEKHIRLWFHNITEERKHGAALQDVPQLIADYHSPNEQVRATALKRSCPCHVNWEVYERLRKPALRLRADPSPVVRALANHLEEDARVLHGLEAALERLAEYEDRLAEQHRPSSKESKRPSRQRRKRR